MGSRPAFRRPVAVVQGDTFNRSRLATTVCVVLSGNLRRALSPGNVLIKHEATGLREDSVAVVSQLVTLNKDELEERIGRLRRQDLELILDGINLVLGR